MNPCIQTYKRISDNLQAETIEGELDSEAILESDTIIDGSSWSDVELSDSDTDDLAEKLSDWASTFSIPLTATSGLHDLHKYEEVELQHECSCMELQHTYTIPQKLDIVLDYLIFWKPCIYPENLI